MKNKIANFPISLAYADVTSPYGLMNERIYLQWDDIFRLPSMTFTNSFNMLLGTFQVTRWSSVEKVTAIRLLFIFFDISFIKQTSNWRSHTNIESCIMLKKWFMDGSFFSSLVIPLVAISFPCSFSFFSVDFPPYGICVCGTNVRWTSIKQEKRPSMLQGKILAVSCCLRCAHKTLIRYLVASREYPRHDVNEKITRTRHHFAFANIISIWYMYLLNSAQLALLFGRR